MRAGLFQIHTGIRPDSCPSKVGHAAVIRKISVAITKFESVSLGPLRQPIGFYLATKNTQEPFLDTDFRFMPIAPVPPEGRDRPSPRTIVRNEKETIAFDGVPPEQHPTRPRENWIYDLAGSATFNMFAHPNPFFLRVRGP